MTELKTEVLIIGAGPAGCIAAAKLRQLGHDVIMVEKQKFPRFVIGESLLPRFMDHLTETDLFESINEAGFQVKNGAKFVKEGKTVEFDFKEKFSEGWDWTWQVTRADFDKKLSDAVQSKGVKIYFNSEVKEIDFVGSKSTTRVAQANGETTKIKADFIIDASGYGRVIPKLFDLNVPSNIKPREALFAHFKDPKRPPGLDGNRIIAKVLKDAAWAWVIPFSNGHTSLGVVGDLEYFQTYPEEPKERLYAIINECEDLKDRFKTLVFEPRQLGGYSIAVKQMYGKGYVLAGNATEFLDPIFSSGVTLAAETGVLAAKLVSKELNQYEVDWEKEYSEYINSGIDVFRSYVEAWYSGDLQEIFFSLHQEDIFKKQICSVLAGYVWDETNPFVQKHKSILSTLASVIRMKNNENTEKNS